MEDSTYKIKMKEVLYHHCLCCGAYFMNDASRLRPEGQKERYLRHNNNLADEGYRRFLEGFLDPVSSYLRGEGLVPEKILDYGSGPEPALVELMKSRAGLGELPADVEVRGWDPFFAPDTPFFEGGADLVTCLEVAEHFEEPEADFRKLASAVRIGGYVAVGTMTVPGDGGEKAFSGWWYRSDATHVSFYTEKALEAVAGRSGLRYEKKLTDRVFLFRRVS